MKDTVYICGHKNPDLDSIASAISYAYYKNQIGDKIYLPIRIGDVNKETKYVLDYFKIGEPTYMDTLRLKVSDLELSTVESLKPDISIRDAEIYLDQREMDYISVVNDKNKLYGVLTKSSLNKVYTQVWNENVLFDSKTPINNIIKTLDATSINVNNDKVFEGKIRIAAMSFDAIKDYINENDIVISGDREDVLEYSINKKVSLIIITGGFMPSQRLIDMANENNVSVISTKYDSFTTARFLILSIPISYVMSSDNLISFDPEDLVSDVRGVMIKNRYRAYPVVDDSGYVYGTISRYSLLSKDKKQIIQVDHNEIQQAIDGIEDAEIVEIIDHHRVMGVKSNSPIYIRNEPVGSTSTIVAKIFFEHNVVIPKQIAGLLMSGIISDTLLFKSPTCTKIDVEICEKLAIIAEINNLNIFAHEMQKVATSLDGVSSKEIINTDFKDFKIEKYRIGIAQFNTIDLVSFEELKDDVISYMNTRLENGNYDIILLALTNIIDEGSLFIAVGEINLLEKSFDVKFDNNEVYIKGILSRKKQIVPTISKYLSE